MFRKITATFLAMMTLILSDLARAATDMPVQPDGEYSHVPVIIGGAEYNRYLDQKGIKRIRLVKRSSQDNKRHWIDVVGEKTQVLKTFSDIYQVSSLAEGRYKEQASLLVVARRKKCDEDCSHYYLFRTGERTVQISKPFANQVKAAVILKDQTLVTLHDSGLQLHNLQSGIKSRLTSPDIIVDGVLGSDIEGKWRAIAVSDNGSLMVAGADGWRVLPVALAPHSDREGVVSIYPAPRDRAVIAIYRYINEYNKGLYIIEYDLSTGTVLKEGWLFNSENRNIGFDPSIYLNDATNEVVVTGTNSSISQGTERFQFRISPERMERLDAELPQHIQESGFEREKIGSLMLGAGVSQVGWSAHSSVKKNDTTFAEVEYLISDSLFLSTNLEARLGDTSLTISYLQNRAEAVVDSEIDDAINNNLASTLTKEASSYLFSTIDFHGMLGASSSLRLQLERGDTKGVAEVSDENSNKTYSTFSTRYSRIALLTIRERGFYLGGDYVNYDMPSAVGFSNNNGGMEFAGFDPGFEFSSVRFVVGYDALAYAKRYETDYSRFYWSGAANIGLGWASLSMDIKNQAAQATGKSDVANLPIFLALGTELELGYIWQKRSRDFKGLGTTIALGYRVNANLLRAGHEENASSEDLNSLFLEFSRRDVFYGPFIKGNIIF